MKKTILILALALSGICSAQTTNITGVFNNPGVPITNNLVSFYGGQYLNNNNFLKPTNGADSSTSSLTVAGGLKVNGGVRAGYLPTSSNYTLTGVNYVVQCTGSSTGIWLPTAVGRTGQIFIIKAYNSAFVAFNGYGYDNTICARFNSDPMNLNSSFFGKENYYTMPVVANNTVHCFGSETIDANSTVVMSQKYTLAVMSTGTNWIILYIVAGYTPPA